MDRFGKAALEHVSVGQKIVGIRIPRIECESGGKIAFGVGKMVAAARDLARENEERRTVRQPWPRDREFFLSAVVVAQTPEVIIGLGEMRFSGVRTQTK